MLTCDDIAAVALQDPAMIGYVDVVTITASPSHLLLLFFRLRKLKVSSAVHGDGMTPAGM